MATCMHGRLHWSGEDPDDFEIDEWKMITWLPHLSSDINRKVVVGGKLS